jgi:hypothetical protein
MQPMNEHPRPWRVGRSVGRTIYDATDELIGLMDTPELAEVVVGAVNAVEDRDEELVCTNCGNDLACEGYLWCSDCMEEEASEPGHGRVPARRDA